MSMHNQIMEYHNKLLEGNALYSNCCRLSSLSYQQRFKTIRLIRFTLVVISLLLFCDLAAAKGTNILMLKSGNDSVYSKVTNAAIQRLERICAKNSSTCRPPAVSVETIGKKINNGKWDLIVTIGTKAANIVSRSGTKTPTLYSLIPSISFNKIRNRSNSSHTSAIYIDQPIARQLSLVKAVLPERKDIGVLLGRYATVSKSSLQKRMHSVKLNPSISHANPDNITSVIEGVFKKTNVLLALPDPSIYNKKSVVKILLSSYRYRVPVIGYSAAFVKSGAIAAVFSTPRDIGRHIGDEIVRFSSTTGSNLSSPSYPRYFSIKVNKSVSNSLNIRMPSISTIKSRMMKTSK